MYNGNEWVQIFLKKNIFKSIILNINTLQNQFADCESVRWAAPNEW